MENLVAFGSSVAAVTQVTAAAGRLPGVIAISLGGSVASRLADTASDLDFHVYWEAPLAPPDVRAARLSTAADTSSVRVGVTSWGLEDWLTVDGRPVELIYVGWSDVQAEIERAYREGLTARGCTTARLYNVAHGRTLYDPAGVLGAAQERLNRVYPEATRTALLRRQPALLAFFLQQLCVAQQRGDLLFVQDRRYTLQIIFFDLLFALNHRYHPGEKRLLAHAAHCPIQPDDCTARWERVARLPADAPALAEELGALIEELRELARRHGGIPIPDAPL